MSVEIKISADAANEAVMMQSVIGPLVGRLSKEAAVVLGMTLATTVADILEHGKDSGHHSRVPEQFDARLISEAEDGTIIYEASVKWEEEKQA